MSRGILSGVIWGAVTGSAVVSVLSLYTPLPGERAAIAEPESETPTEVIPATEQESPTPEVEAEQPAETEAKQEEPAPEDTGEAPAPDAQTDAPQTAAVADDGSNGATAVPGADPSVTPAQAPALTSDEAEVAVTTQDAPTAPDAQVTASDTPDAPSQEGETPQVTALADAPASDDTNPSALSLPQVDATPDADGETAPRVIATVKPDTPDPAGDQTAEATPVSADTPIILPVPKIDNPVAGVVTNRLPSLTTPTEPAAEEPVQEAALDATEVGALRAYASTFEATPAAGQLSVILIDTGADGMPRSELVKVGIPFSIAIDPAAPDAAKVAAEYRAAGIEVLAMLGDLPTSAAPGDVAVALEGYFGVLTEAIAVMDPLDGRIQSNRSLLQPVLGKIRDTGHGLVTYDRGLNTAQQAARREGIAAATVFRLLDAELEEGPKIKRYLSRAAFTASKDGSVVVLGRTYSATVKALLEWSLDEKGGDLAIVPVSQVMLQELG